MQRTFITSVDAIEPTRDRLNLKFYGQPGGYWINHHHEEMIADLRRVLNRGANVEVTVEIATGMVTDVILR